MRVNSTAPLVDIREFKKIATAGATTAAVTEKVWEITFRWSAEFLQRKIQRCQKHGLRS